MRHRPVPLPRQVMMNFLLMLLMQMMSHQIHQPMQAVTLQQNYNLKPTHLLLVTLNRNGLLPSK